jgi:hypothetical protein
MPARTRRDHFVLALVVLGFAAGLLRTREPAT